MHNVIEIYKNSSERLILNLGTSEGPMDADAIPTITIEEYDTGEPIVVDALSTRIDIGVYGYNTSLALSATEQMYRATWSFVLNGEAGTWEQVIAVISPYTTPAAVLDRFPDDKSLVGRTWEELRDAERTVRHVINSFTGQSFNLEADAVREVRGTGGTELYLPKRIVRLISVQGVDGRYYSAEINDASRSSLRKVDDVLPYSAYTDGATLYGVPVGVRSYTRTWRETLYRVTGDWGWEHIPPEVTEAAVLLVRDAFAPDSKYFEMYVDNIRASDWRMEFAKTGDKTTGNARADILLSRFHSTNWMII